MITHKILSWPSDDKPHPWVEFEVTDGSLDITLTKANGLGAFHRHPPNKWAHGRSDQAAAAADARAKASIGKRKLRLSKTYPDEMHTLYLDLDGNLVFHAVSENQDMYYTHLATYHPDSGEWERLVFLDATNRSVIDQGVNEGLLSPPVAEQLYAQLPD